MRSPLVIISRRVFIPYVSVWSSEALLSFFPFLNRLMPVHMTDWAFHLLLRWQESWKGTYRLQRSVRSPLFVKIPGRHFSLLLLVDFLFGTWKTDFYKSVFCVRSSVCAGRSNHRHVLEKDCVLITLWKSFLRFQKRRWFLIGWIILIARMCWDFWRGLLLNDLRSFWTFKLNPGCMARRNFAPYVFFMPLNLTLGRREREIVSPLILVSLTLLFLTGSKFHAWDLLRSKQWIISRWLTVSIHPNVFHKRKKIKSLSTNLGTRQVC